MIGCALESVPVKSECKRLAQPERAEMQATKASHCTLVPDRPRSLENESWKSLSDFDALEGFQLS